MQSLFNKHSELVYFLTLAISCATCFWGNFLITISTILLAAFWIFDGNYRQSLRMLVGRKSALCFLAIPLVVVLRMIVQLPDDNAITFISKYLQPLIFIFVIGSKPELSKKKFHMVLFLFVASIVINSFYNTIQYALTHDATDNFRSISPFISYIRLTLFVLTAIFACAYLLRQKEFFFKYERIFLWLSMIWLTVFVIILKSITGYVILCASIFLFLVYLICQSQDKKRKIVFLSLIAGGFLVVFAIVYSEAKYFLQPDSIIVEELEQTTPNGNAYTHNVNYEIENGHYVNIYICQKELAEAWHERTQTSIWAKDRNENIYYYTLIRYMTSKNLRKDKTDFDKLTDKEILAVQNSFTNYRFLSNSKLNKRIYEAIWELYMYANGTSPDNHSIPQRFEFAKCTFLSLQEKNIWFGLGANVRDEMRQTYEKMNSLSESNWNLPHNQYLLMLILCGIVGFVIFVLGLIGAFVFSKSRWNILTIGWFLLVVISCFSEDSFNTAAGQVCCCLFGSLLLFCQPAKQTK